MKKRTVVKIISFLLAAVIVLFAVLINYYNEYNFYKTQVKYTYSRAFEELNSCLNNININLEKASYVTTSTQMNNIATSLFLEAKMAKQAFAQFPSGNSNYEMINKFLSQIGNYSVFLAKKVMDGGVIEETERQNLEKLNDISKKLSDEINLMHSEYNNSGSWDFQLSDEIQQEISDENIASAFTELEGALTDYPTLIYDGPYSDYIFLKESEMLKKAEPVDENTAREVAASALNIAAEELTLESMDEGVIEAYNFVYGEGAVSVSVKGGYLVYFRKYSAGGVGTLSYAQAVSKAQKYLSRNSEENFLATYYYADNGVCVVNFAAKNGVTVCYTDLVKIGVDLTNGEVVFYEGRGYLTNHKNRALETPANTVEQARAVLSPSLTEKSYALALIPTDGGYEKHCYEFTCTGTGGEEVLVYINIETLQEEDILLLIKDGGGTLIK